MGAQLHKQLPQIGTEATAGPHQECAGKYGTFAGSAAAAVSCITHWHASQHAWSVTMPDQSKVVVS